MQAKQRAKQLFEFAQAKRALASALQSRDESLLTTALETAKRVGLNANVKYGKHNALFCRSSYMPCIAASDCDC